LDIGSYTKNKKEFYLFLRFCLVGVLNAIIGLGTILILYNVFHVDYRFANAIGFLLALANSFILNKLWTFKSNKKFHKEIPNFLFIFLVSYLINFIVLIFSADVLLFDKNLCQVIGMIFYTVTNYIGNKYLTFKKTLNEKI
jgi:putative flippase GtrA